MIRFAGNYVSNLIAPGVHSNSYHRLHLTFFPRLTFYRRTIYAHSGILCLLDDRRTENRLLHFLFISWYCNNSPQILFFQLLFSSCSSITYLSSPTTTAVYIPLLLYTSTSKSQPNEEGDMKWQPTTTPSQYSSKISYCSCCNCHDAIPK